MKILDRGSNYTEVELFDGTRVLFSYETPVAFVQNGKFRQTNKKFSKTTTKHIRMWLKANDQNPENVEHFPQETIENIVRVS